MIVRYWQPWREVDTLRRQMDRLFDELTEPGSDRPTWAPAVELKDAGANLVLRVQLPGVEAKDLDVQVTQETVTLLGEHRYEQQAQENGYYKSEFRYGKFHRVIDLPAAVQNENVQANYKDGILQLTLPKVVETRNKAVKINLTSDSGTESTQAQG